MGKKDKKKHKKRGDLLRKPEALIDKSVKWCIKGKNSKLASLFSTVGYEIASELLKVKDSHGQALLHQACRSGHRDVVRVLLKFGADTEQPDADGNTPAHVAAAANHLDVLVQLLQSTHPPDIDLCNHHGISIRQYVEQAMRPGTMLGLRPVTGSRDDGAGSSAQGRAHEGEEVEDEELAWRRRLREEASDGEEEGGGGAGWGGVGDDEADAWSSWDHGAGAAGRAETEDEWADRMWQEMARKRRQQASEAAGMFASAMARERIAQEAAARAAAAVVASARILHQERAKDDAWRRRAGGIPALEAPSTSAPSVPPPSDPAAAHAAYEAHWLALDVQLGAPGQQLGYADLPWPLPEFCPMTPDNVRDVVLHGVQGPNDIKKRIRRELMRWHPDKFMARIGPRLGVRDAARVSSRAKEVSQALTALMSNG